MPVIPAMLSYSWNDLSYADILLFFWPLLSFHPFGTPSCRVPNMGPGTQSGLLPCFLQPVHSLCLYIATPGKRQETAVCERDTCPPVCKVPATPRGVPSPGSILFLGQMSVFSLWKFIERWLFCIFLCICYVSVFLKKAFKLIIKQNLYFPRQTMFTFRT